MSSVDTSLEVTKLNLYGTRTGRIQPYPASQAAAIAQMYVALSILTNELESAYQYWHDNIFCEEASNLFSDVEEKLEQAQAALEAARATGLTKEN